MEPSIVYVKLDENSIIKAVLSSAFLPDTSGWVEIDSGYGDKYHHAQNHYFSKPIMDEYGVFRYKIVNGKPVERTQAEMDEDRQGEDNSSHTLESRVEKLENSNAELTEAMDMILSGVTSDE